MPDKYSNKLPKWSVLVLATSSSFCYTTSAQVYTDNGAISPAAAGTPTENTGINIDDPKGNLDVFQELFTQDPNPGFKMRSQQYYLPPGEYISGDPSICLMESNIIEVDAEFSKLACDVANPPAVPAIPPTTRLLTMTKEGKFGLGLEEPRSLFHAEVTDPRQDIISLSYNDNGTRWNYLNMGHNYLAFNARQNFTKWQVDDGSYLGAASRIEFGWEGLSLDVYNHPTNQQGAPTQTWTNFQGSWKPALLVDRVGDVRIGDKRVGTGPHVNNKLSVDGKVVTKELVITSGPEWADYVFDDNYKLMALSDVEAYISQHGHLPNIPPASEINSHGMNVSQIAVLQMEKIEELTLHLIMLNKEVDILRSALKQRAEP